MREGFAKAEAAREKIRDEAAAAREKIRDEAAADREKIRDEAAADRERVRTEVRDARRAIEGEMNRQNQNYIEHLAYHNTRNPKPDLEEEDDGT